MEQGALQHQRLLPVVAALDAPIVQLWGWPGCDRRAFLDRLLADDTTGWLAVADLADPSGLEVRLEDLRDEGCVCYLTEHPTRASVDALAGRLLPRERVIFSTDSPLALSTPNHVTAPEAWFLSAKEAGELWREEAGGELSPDGLAGLVSASAVWPLVLKLWAADPALADGVSNPADPRALAATSIFFRERVLAGIGDFEERDLDVPRPLEAFLTQGPYFSPARVSCDVSLRLFGVPTVSRHSGEGENEGVRVDWPFKRPLMMLSFLATRPTRQAPREEMIDALWGNSTEDAVRRNLHSTVSRLRRTRRSGGDSMERIVVLEAGAYRLDPELRWNVDVEDFQHSIELGAALLSRGDAAAAARKWRAAWRLYQGPFMGGHEDHWALTLRSELYGSYLRLLRDLGELYLDLEELGAAEDALRSFLLEDPLEERVYVSMMRVYAGRGRRDLVNRQYERLRSVLSTELGVEPSADTLAVYNELMV
ncbi:MAG: BTAD domain-containing putative transcriptional regulator [Acidobacteriota bacterium]|nr:BTAD domain-containing putative transcriptional regulator [Acidobacteriota bacterium]